jgi:hypothetical protein
VTAQLCGLEECASPCHQSGHLGPYCAPLRCYCGGCPAHVPVDRSRQGKTQEQLKAEDVARAAAGVAAVRAALRG